jgi:hypothetical protein
VPDTADTTEPAGQADDTTTAGQPAGQASADTTTGDDVQAQQMLTDALSQDDNAAQNAGGDGKKDPWDDPESARREIEKVRREAAKWRTQYRDAEPQLAEYKKWLDSQKTEHERLAEAKETAERELTTLRSANARLMAAATHNLPPDLIDFLGDGTEEQIDERARVLAARLAAQAAPAEPATESPRPAPRRPVESLTPGARPAGAAPADPNDAFREFLNARRA